MFPEVKWRETITVTREQYTLPGMPGRYFIDRESGSRWYEAWYTPHSFSTTAHRIQIEHTDQHIKALGAIQDHATRHIANSEALNPKE